MKISIHIHSEYSSDSRQTVASILEESRRLGFDAIAITDHNTVSGGLAALKIRPEDISVIIGAEFSTDKGHILALFIDDTIEKGCRTRNAGSHRVHGRHESGRVYELDDLIARVRGQGGLLFLAHPLESSAVDDPSFIAKLDGYERINGRINSGFKNKRANALSETLKTRFPDKVLIGGSDAHTKAELKGVYMMSDSDDPRVALMNADTICFNKSSMAKIRWHTMKSHKNRPLKYYVRQTAAILCGLFYDLGSKLRGGTCEIIRVREKTQ
jgi:predicted metal-dependent phosphoesterase TrpH